MVYGSYLFMPFIAWLCAGIFKFIINSWKAKCLAFHHIGYGGLPSNHSAIVSSMATLIALQEGIDHPATGVAVTLAFIVMLDANSLRWQIQEQAKKINRMELCEERPLRERIGHTRMEIFAGMLTGMSAAYVVFSFNLMISV